MAQVNPGRTSLLAWWALNESSGNATDSHTNSLTLTDNNTVTSATGKVSGARQFTAANTEYFSRASESALQIGNNDATIFGWAYLDSKGADRSLISKYDAAGNLREFFLLFDNTNDRFSIRASSNGTAVTAVLANALGSPWTATWYFIVVRYNATTDTLKIRVNNGVDNSGSHASGFYASTAPFALGAFLTGSLVHNGRLDEWGIYKGRELTDDECEWLYNSGNGRTYAETATATGTLTATLGAVTLSATATKTTPKMLYTRLRNYVLRTKRSGY